MVDYSVMEVQCLVEGTFTHPGVLNPDVSFSLLKKHLLETVQNPKLNPPPYLYLIGSGT